jgi:N-methylhydantoinase B/acetone carboxylase, alpha subunit
MSYQIELFQFLLSEFLTGDAALVQIDGEVLALKGDNPTCYGTLRQAAQTATKYLKLKEGEIAILNDPYSGGTTLSDFIFVMAISEDLLWVKLFKHPAQLKIAKSIEEEGLRIPPTPLWNNGRPNSVILQAMQAHPACPPNFATWAEERCKELVEQSHRFIQAIEVTGFNFNEELIEDFIKLSRKCAQGKIHDAASGEARAEVYLNSGDMIRATVEVTDGKVHIDFGGTTASQVVHLTDAATYGVCYKKIADFYGFPHLANSGTYAALQVTKPAGCLLSSKYPAPATKGMQDGVAALEAVLQLALNQILKTQESAIAGSTPLSVQFTAHGHSCSLRLPNGQGASSQKSGKDASSICEDISIEQIERDLPVRVLKFDLNQTCQLPGKIKGGRGLSLKVEALDDVQVCWLSDLTKHRPRLTKNCSHGDINSVVVTKDGQQESLPPQGYQTFAKGSILEIFSASGGGYGQE